jgi:hypothetical protein
VKQNFKYLVMEFLRETVLFQIVCMTLVTVGSEYSIDYWANPRRVAI